MQQKNEVINILILLNIEEYIIIADNPIVINK